MSKVTITPYMASEWLKHNSHNRKVRRAQVLYLKNQIIKGYWMYNGDAIRFSVTGKLIDGQHRLLALIEASSVLPGVTIESEVIHGISDKAFPTIDGNLPRTPAQSLEMEGFKETKLAASAAALLLMYKKSDRVTQSNSYKVKPSPSEILELVHNTPEIYNSISKTRIVKKRGNLLPCSIAVALHVLYSKVDPYLADAFFKSLGDGVGLEDGSPVLALRTKLTMSLANKHRRRKNELIAWTLIALNKYFNNERIKLIRHSGKLEDFPEILKKADDEQ